MSMKMKSSSGLVREGEGGLEVVRNGAPGRVRVVRGFIVGLCAYARLQRGMGNGSPDKLKDK
jgi:hypothetical protein